ncbi:hypothetical protein FC83_GL002641 [Agrilactobacillus composti DSM 18527 = JCM 14202]|uniref:QueT transporter family protein n=2 Tax=Agrilactobacillus TaxID=2767875 RepID=A0A0R1YD02_9LACO|nr:hypothetical protein FC83_GL002641 [Agrilactobacillus composti DSM 18527 = JCM 14202]
MVVRKIPPKKTKEEIFMVDKVAHNTLELTKIAVVAALYVAVTLLIAPLSYGAIQLRLAEGFNHLAVFNKRYIIALTIGCALANIVSPLGIIDIIFGSLGTLVMTSLSYFIAKRFKSVAARLMTSTIICTLMTFSVALELMVVNKLPFWPTYGTVALGEFVSLLIGAVVIYVVQKRVALSD